MRKGNLTREQVVELVGKTTIYKLDGLNCDFTNRVQCDGDDSVEFSASIRCEDKDGEEITVEVYYYQDPEDLEDCDDLGSLNWEINGYEIF